ncbi:MAG TPA: helix-turn-helix domain-containing protein [Frankiaceae bacterium]|nr:helix-turn-helix domain-containing protein [Frankiaceae bacterium]
MEPLPELSTANVVARTLNVTPDTVRRWARTGKLPVVTLPSGQKRFRREDVEKLLVASVSEQVSA